MKTLFRSILVSFLAVCAAGASTSVQVYTQTPDPSVQSGGVVLSAWYAPGGYGSDADFYSYDAFVLPSDTAITEIDWRGGGGSLADGSVASYQVCIFDSIAGGYEPLVTNPQLPEFPLVRYTVSGTAANETFAGTFGGTAMYNYKFTPPVPFQAAAGHKYWLRVQASQNTYPPSWGMASGTGGDGSHFVFSTGMARFYFSSGDAAFALYTLSGSTYRVTAGAYPASGGSATGGGIFPNGTTAALSASPAAGYGFVNWTENGVQVSTNPNYTFTPTRSRDLVANFAPAYTISTSVDPSTGGSTTGDGAYTYGSIVTVTATPSANYAFVNWTENGVPVSVAAAYSFQASADRVLVANFVPASVNVSTVYSQPHDGTGAIRLSSWWSPDGYDGDTYSWDNFTLATSATLTEIRWRGGYAASYSTPVQGFDVSIWPSIAAGSQPDIIAGPLKTYNVTGNAGETAAGTFGGVALYDYKLVLPTSFSAAAGTKYWIRIRAAQGYMSTWGLAAGSGGNGGYFQEVIGGSGGGGNAYRGMSGDLAFTLLSQASGYSIATIASPSNGGMVTGAGAYSSGSQVTVTATPAAGYTFVNWNANGVAVSGSATYRFTASANRTLVANFLQAWTIAAEPAPASGGTVTGAGAYLTGTTVTLHATPAPGYGFVNWTESGMEVGNLPTLYLTADSDRAITANFVPLYGIQTGAAPASGGFVSGSGTYSEGSTVTLASTPNTGYAFVNWTENGAVVGTQPLISFLASSARTLVANFAPACAVLTAAAGGGSASGGIYPAGTTAQVTATPATGYSFAGWTENNVLVSSSANYLFTASTGRALTANFVPDILGVTFDFDSSTPSLASNQSVRFAQAAGGISARFDWVGDSLLVQDGATGGFTVAAMQGNCLGSNSPAAILTIEFSKPVASVSLNFATLDSQDQVTPSIIQLSAFNSVGSVGTTTAQGVLNPGDTYPSGTLTFTSAVPFTQIQVEVPAAAVNYLVDNIAVGVVPELKVAPVAAGGLQLSWPAPVPYWVLEESPDLSNWSASAQGVTVSGSQSQVTLAPGAGRAFFRLARP
jgi:hypothetical protein